ncbi:serine/threonine protein phosphatase [Pseudomonas carnis]|uniref:PP2C family protein-serine/threonine phosphatase n=1 Tax=Pseudomonas carnis TaxID=2487355 RepID=UPI001C6F724D|nr:serine/threonine protein phosphatase [Pseudomonas carnis]MBW9240780.1 serine/threonine protein phosphatase [Pseudomonas carnis]
MIRYSTRTVKGQDRDENRDRVGAAYDGVRGIFVVVDGTSKPGSGQLAQALVDQIFTGYQARIQNGVSDSSHDQVESLLKDVLQDAHTSLFSGGFTGSASYLVAVISGERLTVAYEGDCSAGVTSHTDPITWFTAPHCLANWRRDRSHSQLATDKGRHQISRSFKARKNPDPEFVTRAAIAGETLVFATDGFWADLSDASQKQLLGLDSHTSPYVDDDVTWIVVQI